MRNFLENIVTQRWYLHLIVGAYLCMMLIAKFPEDAIESLRIWELLLVFTIAGIVIGGFFEWVQAICSGRNSENWILIALHYLKLIPQNVKVEGTLYDALATGSGFFVGTLIYWVIYL